MTGFSSPVLVVGAGIAGLAAGLALRNRGLPFQIVDRRPAATTEGVGIVLTGNAIRALAALGVAESVIARGESVHALDFVDQAGQPIFTFDLGPRASWGKFTCLHRHVLHGILLAAVGPAHVSWGRQISSLCDTADGVTVQWSDGAVSRHPVVVGADGVHSDMRRRLFGPVASELPEFTGWRFLARRPPSLERPLYMLGNGCTLLLHPLPGGDLYCGAGPAATSLAGDEPPHAQLRRVFGSFGGPAREVVGGVTEATNILATTYHCVELPRWHDGHCVLIGDAAHASPPTLAQGGAMALEDGVLLAQELAEAPETPAALTGFVARRRPRVAFVQQASLARMQANRPIGLRESSVRNALMRVVGPEQLAAAWEPLMTGPQA